MSDGKGMERIFKRLSMNGTWVNHGMVGSVLMIPVSKAKNIVKEELEKNKLIANLYDKRRPFTITEEYLLGQLKSLK